jgi:hypothetical protein
MSIVMSCLLADMKRVNSLAHVRAQTQSGVILRWQRTRGVS